ncbi:DUF3791 domain-containing protein [Erysipelotrichaceae bacterium 51-3]
MNEELHFFVYLLEKYAEFKGRKTRDVFREWKEKDLIQEIQDGYWVYHSEVLDNAFMDIDSLLETGEHAF